ncbi:MAG: hypothetical protein M1832_002884 [Thelocarpon impressellum]|nr:MAG: hypothetical protein M1832_002884 [Thelocarpon impressellum]
MPGRVSTRSGRSSAAAIPRKSSVKTLNSRASASRISSPHVLIPEEAPPSELRTRVCGVFADAQRTTAGHRKLVIILRKIQASCCYKKAGTEDAGFDEEGFNAEVGRCVIRVMGVKKSESVGDRVVRFLGLYLKHASEKDNALIPQEAADETEAFPDTPTTRLTSHVLSLLLPLLSSKEKTVRYRSTQLISHIINSLDSIDDDLFQMLRLSLLRRIHDKEAMVRVQAVLGLGRLAGNETEGDQDEVDNSDDEDGMGGLTQRLLEVLQNDASADVRRSLLLNLPLTPSTLPYLLERARDQDAATRRALYSRLLPALGDFRHLSLSMREKLLRWGLRDRDEGVRKAAGKLFRERWIEDCAGTRALPADGSEDKAPAPSFDGLLELLERIDVVNSGVENGVALEAMKGFWEGRPDYREAIALDDAFWDRLTAESVFMARSFNDFCRQEGGGKFESLVEDKMPEVTKFAFYLERYTNSLVKSLKKSVEEGAEEEDHTVEQEFIVEQLLHMALPLDYTDEVGRRKMFALLRETLAIAELPEEVTKLVIEVLRGLCGGEAAGEREFCGVVLEAVAEVHDTIMSDEETSGTTADDSFHSARSELSSDTPSKKRGKKQNASEDDEEDEQQAIREIMVNMKCLHIAQCMLSNVEGGLQSNIHLVTMLNNLVVPAVRSHEAPIRERGLLCLGLCCLLDRTLAEENITLFLHCFNKGHDALQVYALHILCDILTVHGPTLLASAAFEAGKPLFKMFGKALRADERPEVQAAACTAACKLMLGRVVRDDDLLKLLVLAYFDPSTAGNLGLRQALSYFLPVYCHSRGENQARMGRVAVPVMHGLALLGEDIDEELEEDMVPLPVVAAQLVDWTDPRKLVVAGEAASWDEMGRKESKGVNGDVHLDLAVEVLEKICSSGCSREERKILASMLGKLYITSHAAPSKLRAAHDLAADAVDDRRAASDAPSRNALAKYVAALGKVVGELGAEEASSGAKDVDVDETAEADETVPPPAVDGEGHETVLAGAGAGDETTSLPASDLTAKEAEAEAEAEAGADAVKGEKDSLLDELLEDDDDEGDP